ncbi:MAG: M48 family metallopeptidase [Nitrospinae bacterium]|nr:M48 family metallopeptidase [Nitrospinota bacterium]
MPPSLMEFEGFYYDGKSPTRHPVKLRLNPQHLHLIFPDQPLLSWPYSGLRMTRTGSDGPIRLERFISKNEVTPRSVVIEDHEFLAEAHRVAPGALGSFLAPPQRRNLRRALIVLALVLIPPLFFGIWKFGLPVLSDTFAGNIPVAWEEKLGATVYESMFQPPLKEPPPELRKALDAITKRLLTAVPNQPYQFHIYVHPGNMVNALALPGGTVVVFQGLINATETPEELAGVLAHEYQHVLLKHSTRGIIRQVAVTIVLAAMLGDSNSALAAILETAGALEALNFSRGMETEADQEGMKMVLASGIDPQGMVRVFKKLEEEELRMLGLDQKNGEDGDKEVPGWMRLLSTHPAGKDRVAMLIRMAEDSPPNVRPLLPDVEWQRMHRKANKAEFGF